MISPFLKDKFPFAYNYFSVLLEEVFSGRRKFPQSLIFEGNDTINQYLFALELARNLNCTENKAIDCTCTNCKWIKTYTHPAINIVSQIHYKPDGDDAKTVISVKQAKAIENSLAISSDYHRFFIFFSSREKEYGAFELNDFQRQGYLTDINYSIEPLEYNTFHSKTPNSLLKSIEEPPERTTFVFLTNSKENIISTIVSRCFSFKLGSKNAKNDDLVNIEEIMKDYPNLNYTKALYVVDSFLALVQNGQRTEDILIGFIKYLKNLMLKNIDNREFCTKIQYDIMLIKRSIKYQKAKINDKNVFEGLMFEIVRGKNG